MVARFWFAFLCLVLISPGAFALWWDTAEFGGPDVYTVAMWHFNENAGTTAFDETTNNFGLTLSDTLIWDAANKKFGAASIGLDAAYTTTNDTLLDSPPSNLSISGWVYPNIQIDSGLGNRQYLIRKVNAATDEILLYFENATGKIRAVVNGAGGPPDCDAYSTTSTWLAATWYWIQLTWNATDGLKLYVNGVLEGSDATCTFPMQAGSSSDFFLGSLNLTLASVFNGELDEWVISNVDRNSVPMGTPVEVGDLNILRAEGYDINATPFFNYANDGNVTIDFNVANNDNNRLRLDVNYSSSAVQGTGTVIFEDLNLTSLICPSQNWNILPSTCHLDWNILNSLVSDGNYYLLFDLNRRTIGAENFFKASGKSIGILNNPKLRFHLFDENKLNPILTAIAIMDGITYYAGVDGNITIPYSGLSGEKIVSVGQDGNYEFRNFYFDFSVISGNKDFNAFLLKAVNGESIEFEFYSENVGTKLTNEIVTVIKDMAAIPIIDTNISGRAKLSVGKATFFLNPDANYVFKVVGTSTYYYYPVNLTILVPKNEVSLENISPFDLSISGIGVDQFFNGNSVIQYWIFSNTVPYYIFDINAGLDYYSRQYFLSVKGNPKTYNLQPYLVARADALNSIFYVRNNVSSAGLQNIRIVSKKNIPTQGMVTVEEVVTDSAGEATLSFIQNDTYYLYFYEGEILRYYIELRPNFTSYQVYLDLEKIVVSEPIEFNIDVNFMPSSGIAFFLDGNLDLNQRITVFNGILSNTRVVVTNAGRILYDLNFDANTNSQFFQQRFVDANINQLSSVKVDVTVSASGYTKTFSHSYLVQSSTSVGSQLISSLKNFFPTELGGNGLLLFSVLIVIIVTGFAGSQIGTDPGALGLISIITSGLLCFIGWIPIIVFGGMAAGWLAVYMLTRRLEY